ncbi:MAG: adenylate kinase [Endomicrobiales bacterium]|nr:adenylate kinase [Endomicrobiales bacterium]
MNLIILGPPGAGKGTQAKKIAKKYNIQHVSTGDIFRETSKSGSDLGKKLQSYMSSGALVPDDLVVEIVKERIVRPDCQKGFLLDGFPRTLVQAENLDKVLLKENRKIDKALSLDLSEEEVVSRLSSRRVCKSCGANYNLITQPPKNGEICDNCSGELVQRADDNPETIKQRLKVYRDQTEPLIEYYSKTKILVKIDGAKSINEVFKNICAVIEEK